MSNVQGRMGGIIVLSLLLSFLVEFNCESVPDDCDRGPKGRVPWILHQRQEDYGWGKHTHRAVIALAVNNYEGSADEMTGMDLQLEYELLKELMRNQTRFMHVNDLALFIHALIARGKNPRNFRGIDLVENLLESINEKKEVHPFLVLALCNSRAVTDDHLFKIYKCLSNLNDKKIAETALALKAFACASSLDKGLVTKYERFMTEAAETLSRTLNNGDSKNPYTIAVIVQALTAYGAENWEETKSLDFLRQQSEIEVNIIKAYYIELALNARRVKFIKDIHNIIHEDPEIEPDLQEHFIQYTIKKSLNPKVYFTINIKVPINSTFYDIMTRSSSESESFKFLSYEDPQVGPVVYSVAGIPDDAEKGFFWRLCLQTDVQHTGRSTNRHKYKMMEVVKPITEFVPKEYDHIIFWYRDSECPKSVSQ